VIFVSDFLVFYNFKKNSKAIKILTKYLESNNSLKSEFPNEHEGFFEEGQLEKIIEMLRNKTPARLSLDNNIDLIAHGDQTIVGEDEDEDEDEDVNEVSEETIDEDVILIRDINLEMENDDFVNIFLIILFLITSDNLIKN